jgi:hypothetical protein
MTSTRDKISGGVGDSRPLPQIPASLGDGKKTQRTASVPNENCLTEGVQSENLGPIWVQILTNWVQNHVL